jgi:hypothetical protein
VATADISEDGRELCGIKREANEKFDLRGDIVLRIAFVTDMALNRIVVSRNE